MANEERVRANFRNGFVDDNPLLIGASTLTSSSLESFPTITSAQYAAITLDPQGIYGAPEIVWVTLHNPAATTATILRGQEETLPRQHNQGVRWAHSVTELDLNNPTNYASRVFSHSMWR